MRYFLVFCIIIAFSQLASGINWFIKTPSPLPSQRNITATKGSKIEKSTAKSGTKATDNATKSNNSGQAKGKRSPKVPGIDRNVDPTKERLQSDRSQPGKDPEKGKEEFNVTKLIDRSKILNIKARESSKTGSKSDQSAVAQEASKPLPSKATTSNIKSKLKGSKSNNMNSDEKVSNSIEGVSNSSHNGTLSGNSQNIQIQRKVKKLSSRISKRSKANDSIDITETEFEESIKATIVDDNMVYSSVQRQLRADIQLDQSNISIHSEKQEQKTILSVNSSGIFQSSDIDDNVSNIAIKAVESPALSPPANESVQTKGNTIEDDRLVLNITAITWNLAERAPSMNDSRFLREFGQHSDILCIGIQECEDIKPRRNEGRRSKAWKMIQQYMLGKEFQCISHHKMGGMQLSLYAKPEIADMVEGYQILDCACGIGNVLTNKGGICMILRIKDKSIAFFNAHFAAHQKKIKERNMNYHRILTTIIDKAQTKWLTPPHADYKLNMKRLAADKRSYLSSSILSSSQPFLDQVFSSVGLGSATDITTSVSKSREYKFLRLTDDDYDHVVALKKQPVVTALSPRSAIRDDDRDESETSDEDRKQDKEVSHKSRSSMKKTKANGKYDGKILRKRYQPSKKSIISRKRSTSNHYRHELLQETPPFDAVIYLGDLNYRLDTPRDKVEEFKELLFPSGKPKKSKSNKTKIFKKSFESMGKSKIKKSKGKARYGVTETMSKAISKGSIPRLSIWNSPYISRAPDRSEDIETRLRDVLKGDQLHKQMRLGNVFRGYKEAEIKFIPSFKYDKWSNRFDSSKKYRSPAWTDRILYAVYNASQSISRDKSDHHDGITLQVQEYDCLDCRHSDHRPVYAKFRLTMPK